MTYTERDTYGMYRHKHGAGGGPGPALMGAATLIGDSVVNGDEDHLGDIKEIMLDMGTGHVAYAVLSFSSFLGGEKLVAVPWQALHLDTAGKRFVLNVDKATLKNAPGFNKDAWPDMADIEWANAIHSFYGVDPGRARAPTMGPGVRAGSRADTVVETGTGASIDPRPGVGRQGDDADLSRIRGSNIG